jgi:NADH-quinone oxidoreductase subunit H
MAELGLFISGLWFALPDGLREFLWILGAILILVAVLLGGMAYSTYYERKVLAAMHLRKGPNVVGPFGLFQPIADGLKLLTKETVVPSGADRLLFVLAPILTFVLALVAWAVVPFGPGLEVADINVGVLYLFAISSLGVYGIIIAGWASNSKYAFLGALRSAAQMVSYEVSIGFVIVTVLLMAGSLNLSQIVEAQSHGLSVFGLFTLPPGVLSWFWLPLLPMAVVFVISGLAETNRSPFDLVEGESELVAGYFVEYSSMTFALFFLGEYMNMLLVSGMTTIFFLGGWLSPIDLWPLNAWVLAPLWFVAKIIVVFFVFLWARGTFPRFRYDQLMRLGWKVFLPLSLAYLVLVAGVLVATGHLPQT